MCDQPSGSNTGGMSIFKVGCDDDKAAFWNEPESVIMNVQHKEKRELCRNSDMVREVAWRIQSW